MFGILTCELVAIAGVNCFCKLLYKEYNNKNYKMISKTQISKRILKKKNPEIVNTILMAKKNNLLDLAKRLSGPISKYTKINLEDLNNYDEKKIMVVGKVLGSGEIDKQIKVSALGFSKQAEEKLIKANCEIKTIKDEMESNNKLEGVKII